MAEPLTPAARYGSLRFSEQIEFFRQKLNLPTEAWTDIWEGQHARAFVVAGVMRDDLLADFRAAVDKAIADGATIADFRRDFDAIVSRYGWSYKGSRGWRSRVIYETNLRTSYQAGRYAQLKAGGWRHWRYKHSESVRYPRPMHQSWDGKILRSEDPWWSTHFPPNGWGCKCYIEAVTDRDMERMGRTGPDPTPPIEWEEKRVGVRGPSPRTVRVPKGIDPGWGYNVGEAAWGRQLSEAEMDAWRAAKGDAWERLGGATWRELGRPADIPFDVPVAQLGTRGLTVEQMAAELAAQLGDQEKVFDVAGLPVLVDAQSLAAHLDATRSEFIPLLTETLTDPWEVWVSFERHKGSGQVALRARIIKGIDIGGGKGMLVVANARQGMLEAWTLMPVRQPAYLQKQRAGKLVWGR